MLQIAPSFVPRRQFKPKTTGTKKKLAMNFACSTTIAWTSVSLSEAHQKGTSARTTIDRRLTQTRRRCDARGVTIRLERSCENAPPVTRRIELPVDMIAAIIATRNRDPSRGGITVEARMLDA